MSHQMNPHPDCDWFHTAGIMNYKDPIPGPDPIRVRERALQTQKLLTFTHHSLGNAEFPYIFHVFLVTIFSIFSEENSWNFNLSVKI